MWRYLFVNNFALFHLKVLKSNNSGYFINSIPLKPVLRNWGWVGDGGGGGSGEGGGLPRKFHSITKTCLYNFDPLKSHFYTVKLGFTGVFFIVLISAQKHRLWVLVRTASPRRF